MNWFDTSKVASNNRMFLSSQHRQVIAILKNDIELLSEARKSLSEVVKDRRHPLVAEARGLVEVISKTIRKLGYSVSNYSNETLSGGGLNKANKAIADILEDKIRDSSGRNVPTAYAIMSDTSVWGEIPASSWLQKLKSNTEMAYGLLEVGKSQRGYQASLEIMKQPISTLGAGIATSAATAMFGGMSPFAIGLGKLAYQMWDKSNKRIYEGNLSRLSSNLSSKGSFSPTGNSSVGSAIGSSVGLYDFFNTHAYKARWTKEVLDNLKRISGSSGGSSSSPFGFDKLMPLLGGALKASLIGMAALVGWKIGSIIRNSLMIGGKSLGQRLDEFVGNAYNRIFRPGQSSLSATSVGTIADALQNQGMNQSDAIAKAKDLYYYELAYKFKNKVDKAGVDPRTTMAGELQRNGMSVLDSVKFANEIYQHTSRGLGYSHDFTSNSSLAVMSSVYMKKSMDELVGKLSSMQYGSRLSPEVLNSPKSDSKSVGDPHLDYINMGMMGMKDGK